MGSAFLKLLVLAICLNTFLYLGVNYALVNAGEGTPSQMQDDVFSILLDQPNATKLALDAYIFSLNETGNYTTAYSFNPAGNFSNLPTEQTGSSILKEEGGFAFIDMIRMIIPFVRTLYRIALMPLMLFSYNVMPPLAAIIIAFPLLLLNIAVVMVYFRGGGG